MQGVGKGGAFKEALTPRVIQVVVQHLRVSASLNFAP